MGERLRIYVAGPISRGDLATNVKAATDAGLELIRAGFAPLVPQLSVYMGGPTPEASGGGIAHGDWLAADLPWVAVADGLLRLPGESVGADMEELHAVSLGIPVYRSVAEVVANPPVRCGHPGFLKLLDEMRWLHQKKAADYGRSTDPLANCRAAEEFGLPAWVGVAVRLNDKLHRIKSFCQNGQLANESVEDSFMDLAAYALIALTLYRERPAAAA